MMGAVRGVRTSVPGRDGAYYFEERRGLRSIEADCIVVTDDPANRRADVVKVADWLDVRGEARLSFSDQTDRFWLATLASEPDPDEWRLTGRFQINWDVQPYAFSTAISTHVTTASGAASGSDQDSFVIPDTIDAYPEVSFVPSGGLITSLRFVLNNDEITWNGLLANNNTLVISSISDTITKGLSTDLELTGAYDQNALSMEDADGVFGLLVPGTNTWLVDWSGPATAITITFKWRRRYR
jgi:predicted phage tail component-like protein